MPLIRDYLQALKSYNAKLTPNFVSLEGYVVGRVTVAALRRAGRNLSRDSFLNVFKTGKPFDLGGVRLAYGPADNQGLDQVFLTTINSRGQFAPIVRFGR